MYVTISARRCRTPVAVRERAQERLSRLWRVAPELIGAEIDLSVQRGVHRVDTRLVMAGSPVIRASGTGADFRAALDGALDRARRQITEHKARRGRCQARRELMRA